MNNLKRGIFLPILVIGIAMFVAGIGVYQYKYKEGNSLAKNFAEEENSSSQPQSHTPTPNNEIELVQVPDSDTLSQTPKSPVVATGSSSANPPATLATAPAINQGGVVAQSTAQTSEIIPFGERVYRWVNIEVDSTRPIGAVAFDVDFLSDDSTGGLFTTYFNDQKIGQVDQSVFDRSLMESIKNRPPNKNGQPTFAFPTDGIAMLKPQDNLYPTPQFKNKNIISFRMDAWGPGVSKIKISKLKLGLVDMNIVSQMKIASENRDQLLWQDLYSRVIVYYDINNYKTTQTYTNLSTKLTPYIKDLYFEAKLEPTQKKGN